MRLVAGERHPSFCGRHIVVRDTEKICAIVSPDLSSVCLLDEGHNGPHGWKTTKERATILVGKWHPTQQRRWVWFNPPLTVSEFRQLCEDAR